jgi:hypothetical protein
MSEKIEPLTEIGGQPVLYESGGYYIAALTDESVARYKELALEDRCPTDQSDILRLVETILRERSARLKAEERVSKLAEALEHETWCAACAQDGCSSCNDCTSTAALSTEGEQTK